MEIKELINNSTTFIIEQKDKFAIFEELIDKAVGLNKITDKNEFFKAMKERESLISTGIGFGIAIPHVKIESLKDFFIITALLKNPADWDSIDQKPVKVIFLIGCPIGRHTDYLKILAQIMVVVKNSEKRKKLLNAVDVDELLSILIK